MATDDYEGRIVFAQFDEHTGHPYVVLTHKQEEDGSFREHEYVFYCSKQYELMYYYTGDRRATPIQIHQGVYVQKDGSHKPSTSVYWAAPDVEVKEEGKCRRLKHLPRKYTARKLFDEYDVIVLASSPVYCSTCDDYFPDHVEEFCEHVWWCDECGDVSTPDDRCGHSRDGENENEEESEEGETL